MNPYLKVTLSNNFSKIRGLFPNLKEVTETVGVFRAYQRYYNANQSLVVAVVGDGHKPRTGAYFATNTAAKIISIDPAFKSTSTKIPKLKLISRKVEDCDIDKSVNVVVCVHSHSTLKNCAKTFPGAERIFSIPCCEPDIIPRNFYKEESFVDYNIASEKRTVNVYRLK